MRWARVWARLWKVMYVFGPLDRLEFGRFISTLIYLGCSKKAFFGVGRGIWSSGDAIT
jgi:hypothetical protein